MTMLRTFSKLAAMIFAFCIMIGLTRASGDVGSCTPTMKVFFKGFTGCDSMGFLAAGNDTRVNLVFLMADEAGQTLPKAPPPTADSYPRPSDFTPADWNGFSAALIAPPPNEGDGSWGEGTVCVSDSKGSADFLAALAADKDVTDPEKTALKSAREALKCVDSNEPKLAPPKPDVQSANAKDFAAYLAAVINFYQVSHTDNTAFAALTNAGQPWVREASRYMEARIKLLQAQADAFSDYGTLDKAKVEPSVVKGAKEALENYLKDYPQGSYAASATGLLRRAAWFSNDGSGQLAAYSKLLSKAQVNEASLAVINELDQKLPEEAYLKDGADPVFLAVQDLRDLREKQDSDGKVLPGMKAEVLEAQRQRFVGHEDLFDYLLALRAWLVDNDSAAVLKLLPEKAPTADLTYVEFSRQLLRAAALDATGDKTAGNAFAVMAPYAKQPFQRATLELALAMSDERAKSISAVFEPNSLITAPQIREHVLNYIAGPILLKQQGTDKAVPQSERDAALYRLFARDLVQGRFKGFLDDITLLPPKPEPDANGNTDDKFAAFRWEGSAEAYICPDIVATVKKLVANAKDVQGRLCLGDFFRTTEIADIGTVDKDALGGTGTLFAGTVLARQDFYSDIMKDPAAKRDDKAYALYRAVHCYEPAHVNGCGGKDVPLSTRKAWHDELKAKYGATTWAKDLHYYW